MTDQGVTSKATVPAWQRWLPGVSSGAAVLTTLCCLGLAALISLMTAIGATFMTTDASLRPILAVTLVITAAASALTFWRHRNPFPLILTVLSGALIFWALYGGGIGSGGHSADPAAGHSTTTSEHAPAATHTDSHAPAHSDAHPTSDQHAASGDSHDSTDGHAATAGDSHSGGGHGSTTDRLLVWAGVIVLIGAQVWDVFRVRAFRRREVTPATAA